MPDWIKFPLVLVIVTVISATTLAALQRATEPAKRRIQHEITQRALKVVMPKADSFEMQKAKVNGEEFDYRIAKDASGEKIGYVAKGSTEGYSSRLVVMVGIKPDFTINAIKVLYQKETPGLGDKVEEVLSKKTWWTVITKTSPDESGLRPWFQTQFDDKTAPLKVQKGGGTIEAITGATISSRAVCNAVNEAIENLKLALKEEPSDKS